MPRWIEMETLVNLRDVGGIPTTDGEQIAGGRLLRSDHLQSLSEHDVQRLRELGVTDVVDLRSDWEATHSPPGPLAALDEVAVRRHSLFHEDAAGVGQDKDDDRTDALPAEALPWIDVEPSTELSDRTASIYLDYLVNRPDSIAAALRDIAYAEGATLVHCAAGKDRTGTVVALALAAAGAERGPIVEDYVASTERAQAIVDKLAQSPLYAEELRDRPISSHYTRAETMITLLDHIEDHYGDVWTLLRRIGLSDADLAALRAKLRD